MILEGHERVKQYITDANGDLKLRSEWTNIDSIEDDEGNGLATLLAKKVDNPIEIEKTLIAGETELVIENENINSSATIDIYSSKFGSGPVDMVIEDNGILRMSFEIQVEDVRIKIKIS